MIIDDVIRLVESKTGRTVKKSGHGYIACCPAHEDSSPSLSISQGDEGRVLVNCFSGCTFEAICSSIGIKISELFAEKRFGLNAEARKRVVYPYHDQEGEILFSKIRIEPGFDGRAKSFYWERLNEHGVIVKNLEGCRKVLYRLPELMQAIEESRTVFLVEGEKDADKLRGYGLTASTAPESLKWHEDFTAVLKNADAVILYDMDKTGFERKELLCKSLYGKVKRLRVVDLPGLVYQESHGRDVSDWLAEGNTTTQFLEIVSKASDYAPPHAKGKVRAVTIDEFLEMKLSKREMLLAPFLPSQGLCLLYAKRGVGKTHVALGIAYAVATGGTFLKWHAPSPKEVLYIDGEMPAIAMQERLKRISTSECLKPSNPSSLRLITPDLQEGAMPNLSTKEGREALEELIQGADLIIVDNISTLFRSGIENEAESWQPAQDWALELRRRGKSILFVHHASKNGQQRGTSKREDTLDAVVALKQAQGYSSDQGAAFEVFFEKTRHFAGEDATSFQVQLKEQEDGLWLWEVSGSKPDERVVEIAEAMKEGLTIKQMQQRTGLTKSQIETSKKKAKEQGLI